MYSSIPNIIDVLVVCLIVWLVFGIAGVQLFAGKVRVKLWTDTPVSYFSDLQFYACNDPAVNGIDDCVGSFTVDVAHTSFNLTTGMAYTFVTWLCIVRPLS